MDRDKAERGGGGGERGEGDERNARKKSMEWKH